MKLVVRVREEQIQIVTILNRMQFGFMSIKKNSACNTPIHCEEDAGQKKDFSYVFC